jgi:hypothetical protein
LALFMSESVIVVCEVGVGLIAYICCRVGRQLGSARC